jgi:transcriptional regulator with XRE-family HTH domain
MARPRRNDTAITGKNARLARQFKELRGDDRPLRELSKLTRLSIATLSRVTDPTSCPSWKTTVEYLTAFGEDPDEWRPQWEMCATERQRRAAGVPADPTQRAAYQRLLPKYVLSLHDCAVGLRDLRLWRGNPPYKQMVSRATAADAPVAQATISDVLNAKILPTEEALKGILAGLGMGPDDPEYHEWFEARRVLYATRMREKLAAKAPQYAAKRRVRRTRPMRTMIRSDKRED